MLSAPVRLGPFQIDPQGQLHLIGTAGQASFSFVWRQARCSVRLADGVLAVRAQAGRVPSTAEGAGKRADALALLRAVPTILPQGIGLILSPDHRILLETSAAQLWPSSAIALFTPVIGLLLRLAPVLDLLGEAGLGTS